MRPRFLAAIALVAAALLTPRPSAAQDSDSRVFVGFGPIVYDGASYESGVGVAGRLQYRLASSSALRLGIELGVHTLSALGQSCTLGVPSACSPETPASPVWHLRGDVSRDFFRPLYLTAGLGLYGPVGHADRPEDAAAGLDVGLGFRLSSRVALEISYLHLRAERYLGHSIPLGLKFGL